MSRDAIRMTDDEVAAFLGSNVRCRVGTVDGHGAPRVVPVNYVVLDGRVAFWSDRVRRWDHTKVEGLTPEEVGR